MSEYEKKLEELVEHLTKMLEKRDSGDYVYIITPKEHVHLSSESNRVFRTLNEAFMEWGRSLWVSTINDPIKSSSLNFIDNLKDKIDIYEYNIRSEEKLKVFG